MGGSTRRPGVSTRAVPADQRRDGLRRAWRSITGRAVALALLALACALLVNPDLRTTGGVVRGLGWGALGVAVVCLVLAVTGRYEREV